MRALLPAAAALLAGCSSTLSFTVERYATNSDPEAKAAYAVRRTAAPTFQQQHDMLDLLESSVAQYKQGLQELNKVFLAFTDAPEPEVTERVALIDTTFQPIESAVRTQKAHILALLQIHGGAAPAFPVNPAIEDLWEALPAHLAAKGVLTETRPLEKLKAKIESQTGNQIAAQMEVLKNVDKTIDIPPVPSADSVAKIIKAARTTFSNAHSNAVTRVASLRVFSGDLVGREHEVYQDLADPFLDHISQYPEHWRTLDNSGSVKGGGDTEYILVFENVLDGRWKYLSVDPTKAIAARLRIGRRIMGAVLSAVGIAARAYGVPLPKDLGAQPGTLDFSTLTAQSNELQERLPILRAELESLRSYASAAKLQVTDLNVNEVREQLLRRLGRARALATPAK